MRHQQRANVIFWIGLIGWLLFELASIYFIMPFPGSQEGNSVAFAYTLYRGRYLFRLLFIGLALWGWWQSGGRRKWLRAAVLALVAILAGVIHVQMNADKMFLAPKTLLMKDAAENTIDPDRLVIGIASAQEARAYPIRLLAYHHQVLDTLAGKQIMVTYCNVCRSGRVFEPVVDGKSEQFRLVGMDHFNAMFEDATTGSWWRQATGEAVTGTRKGKRLPELFSEQTKLSSWIARYPGTLIMQEDPAFLDKYDTTFLYEKGKSRKKLTGTDSLSWGRKSWVVGVQAGQQSRAYDWNTLLAKRLLEDTLDGQPLLLVVSADSGSFYALRKPHPAAFVQVRQDTLVVDGRRYRLDGKGIDTSQSLSRLPAYQEFWHSWQQFHPAGSKY